MLVSVSYTHLVYLSLATILAEEGQMEEAFAYLEEIEPDSNWYVASLLVKADLYQICLLYTSSLY